MNEALNPCYVFTTLRLENEREVSSKYPNFLVARALKPPNKRELIASFHALLFGWMGHLFLAIFVLQVKRIL